MSTWTLAAPAAIAGLVTAAKRVAGPQVFDSLAVTASGATEAIVIAGTADPHPADGQHYVEHQVPDPGYTQNAEDAFTVSNEIAVLSGGTDIAAARLRCYEILAKFGQAIADDPTLGGAVMESWITAADYIPRQTPDGAKVVLLVHVECHAFTGD